MVAYGKGTANESRAYVHRPSPQSCIAPASRLRPMAATTDRHGPQTSRQVSGGVLTAARLHTICRRGPAAQPGECYDRTRPFLLGRPRSDRRCAFCQVEKARLRSFDADEAERVAEAVDTLKLR